MLVYDVHPLETSCCSSLRHSATAELYVWAIWLVTYTGIQRYVSVSKPPAARSPRAHPALYAHVTGLAKQHSRRGETLPLSHSKHETRVRELSCLSNERPTAMMINETNELVRYTYWHSSRWRWRDWRCATERAKRQEWTERSPATSYRSCLQHTHTATADNSSATIPLCECVSPYGSTISLKLSAQNKTEIKMNKTQINHYISAKTKR